MPSDSVKAIVLSWLNQSNGNLSDFEQSQKLPREARDINGEKLTQQTSFNPEREEQTIASSLWALEDYQTSKIGVSGDRVKEWADSLGSDRFGYLCQNKVTN